MTPMLPMIIDSFAGGGGASTGIEMALGRSPDVAINHSAAALALHAANHPETLHLDSNIWDVEPREVTKGRKVGLLWASPDCKHFSKAKGGAPRDRNIRDLAWVVVRWAEEVKPDVICMENVEEFQTWGPVDNDGQPIKELAGLTFADWISRLKKAGYNVQHRELRGCDYGAPTIRKRWFLVARRDGRPIVWPKPTHGDPKSPEVRKGKLLPWRTAAECIDWSIACPSIFDSSAEIMAKHGVRAIRPLADNTLARVARGMKRYVIEAERPFLVCLKGTDRRDSATDQPHPTVLAGGGHSALVAPALATYYGHGEGRGVRSAGLTEPLRTVTVENRHALIAPSLTRFNGGATGQDLRDPMATVTANGWIKKPGGAAPLGLLAPYLASIAHGYSGGRREYPLTDPLGTVTVGGIQHAVIAPVLTYAQQGGGNRPVTDPAHTIRASRKDQNCLLAATMVQTGYGERTGQAPRALDIEAPLGTVVSGGAKHALVVSTIVGCGGRAAQSRPRGIDEPMATATAKADACIASAFLAQHHTGATGHDLREPMSTIAASGSHQMPIAAFFAKYYGAGTGSRCDEPAHTITVNDRFAHVQAELQAPPYGPEHHARAKAVAEFLRAHGAWSGGEVVTLTVGGAHFVVVDIGMRMLTPRELFNAQGFPPDYQIEGVWQERDGDWNWKPFAKDVQISCCGNSVCPDLARAIVGANCTHLIQKDLAA